MKKTRNIIFVFGMIAVEIIRLICLQEGLYEWMPQYPVWQQWLLFLIEKISMCGIGIGAVAGCLYSEFEEYRKDKEEFGFMIISITVLFILTILGGFQMQDVYSISYLMRMGSYFIFPLIFIYALKRMRARSDTGGHLAYFWLIFALNIIYISLFQMAGELLVPYVIYQTILEILLIHWIFCNEWGSQLMMGFSVIAENICVYNWYQGKIDFLKRFPSLGSWKFSWSLTDCGIVAFMIFCLILMTVYMAEIEKENQVLLLSTCLGILWETLLKSGMDGVFYMQAEWQVNQGILLVLPFVAVFFCCRILPGKSTPSQEVSENINGI